MLVVCSMQKMEEAEKETRPRVRKRRCNMATKGGEKAVGKRAGKRKRGGTIVKISKNNRDRGERRSGVKGGGMG